MGKRQEDGATVGGIMLRGGHWYARIKVKGRQIWRSAPTKEGAQLLLGRLREDAARERIALPKVQRETLASFAPRFMKEWSKARKDSWRRDERSLVPLLAALGTLRLIEVTPARVRHYMQSRSKDETLNSIRSREAFKRRLDENKVEKSTKAPAPKTLSGASVNREIALLKRMLSFAVEVGELEKSPLTKFKLPSEDSAIRLPVLDLTDESRLFAAVPGWMRLVLKLALLTGCRQGELLALRWRHVDLDAGCVTIDDTKNDLGRTVPLHPDLIAELHPRKGLPEGFVVMMDDGTQPKAHTITQAFKRAACRIGRPDLRWHDTRHVAASRLLGTGASLPEVATVLGHKTLAMSKRYAHASPVRLASLIAMMSSTAMPATETTPAMMQRVEGK